MNEQHFAPSKCCIDSTHSVRDVSWGLQVFEQECKTMQNYIRWRNCQATCDQLNTFEAFGCLGLRQITKLEEIAWQWVKRGDKKSHAGCKPVGSCSAR